MKQTYSSKRGLRSGNHGATAAQDLPPASQGEKGQAMIELALVLPVLLLLLVGMIEFGRAAYFAIEVADAARAGAVYGTENLANAENTGAISQAAQNDAQEIGGSLVVNPTTSCVCPGSATVTGGSCAGLLGCAYPMVYLTVSTSYPLQTLFHYPMIPSTFNLTSETTMPVQRQ